MFSPDGHSVLSASHDNKIKLWDIKGYEEVRVLQGRVLQGHTDAVLSAACSRDGKRIVTASRDRTAKMWDFSTGNLLQTFEEGHEYLASTAIFFPDGKRLLTAAADNTTCIWDLATGTQLLRLDHTGRGSVAVLSHDGKIVLTSSDEKTIPNAAAGTPRPGGVDDDGHFWTAQLWNAETGELIRATKPRFRRDHRRRLFAGRQAILRRRCAWPLHIMEFANRRRNPFAQHAHGQDHRRRIHRGRPPRAHRQRRSHRRPMGHRDRRRTVAADPQASRPGRGRGRRSAQLASDHARRRRSGAALEYRQGRIARRDRRR